MSTRPRLGAQRRAAARPCIFEYIYFSRPDLKPTGRQSKLVFLANDLYRAMFPIGNTEPGYWYQRAAGFSISFFRLSRAGLLYPSPDPGAAWSAAALVRISAMKATAPTKTIFTGCWLHQLRIHRSTPAGSMFMICCCCSSPGCVAL